MTPNPSTLVPAKEPADKEGVSANRRAESRKRVSTPARISWIPPELATVDTAVPRSSTAVTRDVSLTGVSFIAEDAIETGSSCQIELTGLDGSVIKHRAEVIRCQPAGEQFEVAVVLRGRL